MLLELFTKSDSGRICDEVGSFDTRRTLRCGQVSPCVEEMIRGTKTCAGIVFQDLELELAISCKI